MSSIGHATKTKGYSNTIKRVWLIYSRYSFNGFIKSFKTLQKIIETYDVKITIPINAVILERNMDLITTVDSKKIEWAMHGYLHVDYTRITDFKKHIESGKKIFKKANIDLVGFRAPYLSINNNMLNLLSKSGFSYDSSKCYVGNTIGTEKKAVNLILDFYEPMKKWEIKSYNGLKEIPVSLPDDEILVDRLGYKSKHIGDIWIGMCEKLIEKNIIPVIQLHPERARICQGSLESLLDWARKKDVELKWLRDIADNKYREGKTMVLSGDIDYIKISDIRHIKGE